MVGQALDNDGLGDAVSGGCCERWAVMRDGDTDEQILDFVLYKSVQRYEMMVLMGFVLEKRFRRDKMERCDGTLRWNVA